MTTNNAVEVFHLNSGAKCQLRNIRNDLIPSYYLLCFPEELGEPSDQDVTEMLTLGVRHAQQIAFEKLGDREAFSVLYSGYRLAVKRVGMYILSCSAIDGERHGSIQFSQAKIYYKLSDLGKTMPQNSKLTTDGWKHLMAQFDLPELFETHTILTSAYCEKHRRYHTLDHINACFGHLDSVEMLANYPHEIELALWFHDAVYEIFSGSNEEDSAELAKTFLIRNEVCAQSVERVYNLIALTKGHAAPETIDAKLMLDIDLSILGAEAGVYAQFEKDVREEYNRVPSFIFRTKRKEILRSFLERPRIYHTSYFFDRLETQAKGNLFRAIEAL